MKTESTLMQTNSKINVAVVGLGFMGVTHLRAYLDHPGARIVAVCDSTRLPVNGVLEGVAGNIKKSDAIDLGPDVKIHRKIEELLADQNVELVSICTPTPLHMDQAVAALKAGKHVLCEKPLARTSAAAREILSVAERSPGFLMPAMCMRFWPGWSWLKKAVAEKTYGKVLAARFHRASEMPAWSQQGTYSTGGDLGGALFDLHIHDTDFVNHLFGRPTNVFSTGALDASGAINHVVTQYHYPEGPSVHAEGSWLRTEGFSMTYTLYCERATLDYDLARGPDAMQITESGKPMRHLPLDPQDGYAMEVRHMVDCVAAGRRPEIVTASAGVAALELCEAEEKSIRTGRMVAL